MGHFPRGCLLVAGQRSYAPVSVGYLQRHDIPWDRTILDIGAIRFPTLEDDRPCKLSNYTPSMVSSVQPPVPSEGSGPFSRRSFVCCNYPGNVDVLGIAIPESDLQFI